jgi:hypothetical protein
LPVFAARKISVVPCAAAAEIPSFRQKIPLFGRIGNLPRKRLKYPAIVPGRRGNFAAETRFPLFFALPHG